MAFTSLYSGSASIGTTEYSLTLSSTSGVPAAKTDNYVVQPFIDFNALAAGDHFEVRCYEKCRSGGTQRLVWVRNRIYGTQPLDPFPALMLGNGWDITVKKIAGTDRTIEWEIRGT